MELNEFNAAMLGEPGQSQSLTGWVVLVKAPDGSVASVLGPKASAFDAEIATQILRLTGGYTAEVHPLREVDAHDVHADPPNPRDSALRSAAA